MRQRWLLVLSLAVSSTMLAGVALYAQDAPAGSSAKSEAAIRALLQQQIEAWNRHDLQGFMAGYWNSPELTFFSGATVTKGWKPTLERYERSYQSAGKDMGKLEMSDVQVTELGPAAAYATGHWLLTMSDGKTPHGLYTLILRKFPEGWRIIHDGTSAAQ